MLSLDKFLLFSPIVIVLFITLLILLKSNYDSIVFLNIFLLSVVNNEPSPSDLLFIFLILFSFKCKHVNFNKLKFHVTYIVLISLYIILNLISLYKVENYIHSLKYLIITLYLILYSVFIFLYSNKNNYSLVLKAYILSSSFSSLLGFLGYLNVFSSHLTYHSLRVKGLFKDPNVYGPFIVPSVIILIDSLINKKIIFNKPLHLSLIFINITGVILSFSRGAWINLLLAIVVYFTLNIKHISFRKIIIYFLIITLLLSVIWTCILQDDFKSFLLYRAKFQDYDNQRFSAQKSGLSIFLNNLAGYGPGQYEYSLIKNAGKDISAHSLYMRLLLENGLSGFIFLGLVILYILKNLLVLHFKYDNHRTLRASVLFSILLGLLINSIVVDTLHWRHLWFFIGLSLSLIVCKYEVYE